MKEGREKERRGDERGGKESRGMERRGGGDLRSWCRSIIQHHCLCVMVNLDNMLQCSDSVL